MDAAKLRFSAGVAALAFGLAGLAGLTVAATLALATQIGAIWAAASMGAMYLAVSATAYLVFLAPERSSKEEVDDIERTAAEAMADLPIDMLNAFVKRRPLTAAVVAAAAGYSLARDPGESAKKVQKLLFTLL